MHHSYIDKFSYKDSPVHRLDSRVKFIAVLLFTVYVISLPRTSFVILTWCLIGPFAWLVIGKIPLKFAFKHVLWVSPFILVLALSSPWYDRELVNVVFGPYSWEMSRGWLRCFVILGKFLVTMLSLIALVSTTKFSTLLRGLQSLGMPRVLVMQLGMLYRYIFIFVDKVQHMLQARAGRKMKNLGFSKELRTGSSMVGALFLKSLDTAENINIAMQARGFDGDFKSLKKMRIKSNDIIFVLIAAFFVLFLHLVIRPAMS